MGLLGNVTSILDKLLPNRRRRDYYVEGRLIQDLDKALREHRHYDAEVIRKKLRKLQQGIEYSEDS